MQINPKVKRQLQLQHWTFIVLFLSAMLLLAWLSTRYEYQADWTSGKRNTLSDPTLTLLNTISEPFKITAFVSEANQAARAEITRLGEQYSRANSQVEVTFVDPNQEPELVREKNITVDGELILEYQGRQESLQVINEQSITNTIQRLARQSERWIVFLEGHGERNPNADSNFDYSSLRNQLKSKGFNIHTINLASSPEIPKNTSVLIIADPQKDMLNGEVNLIQDYLDEGGNLLWLVEPGSSGAIDSVAEQLGVEFLPGVVVDMNTQLLGISDPRFALVPDYPPHAITSGLSTLSLFPAARALEFAGNEEWDSESLLETLPRSWAETDETSEEFTLDPGADIAGPLLIGIALTRSRTLDDVDITAEPIEEEAEPTLSDNSEKQQRVVIIGDSDFIANGYIGQGGNLDLGLNILNWLSNDDSFIAIPARIAEDKQLELSSAQQAIIGFGFLLVIPLGLIGTGFFVWWKRRRA